MVEKRIQGLAAHLSGNVVTLWWQQGQKEAAGAADSRPLSAACAAGWRGAEAKGRWSRVAVDPYPAQQHLLLASSPRCLAKCFGVSLLFVFFWGSLVGWYVCFKEKHNCLSSGHYFWFLTCHVISVFLKYVSDSTNVVELNCFPLQMSKLYRAFWHPVSSPTPKEKFK